MTLHQAMTQALAKMKVAGLSAPFGSVPTTELEVKLQADAYLEAIQAATTRGLTQDGIAMTVRAFTSGKVPGHDPSKFPSAPEFARAYAATMDAQWISIGVPEGENTVRMIEVRRDTPPDEVARILEAHRKQELPGGGKAAKDAKAAVSQVTEKWKRGI